uniref:RNA helicase n=1 Tax=Chlamydomonas leiostraca TaxID=1034604 RepID=A0A7S0R477_9CHLO|mmetsp:Transcript_13472/g.32991  ORF Transcript_13472/g.32991 Transcript_13472/m.32991 type:complete len:601 (+) Transcript_13472:108-1910(+)|eukprot:CAMPEP_0202885706 /NCGR_PEP_ID=MMETSP1391-20130828/41800_1 /ASSEMBLY_ACC=CAM_ASM_000867 /TAXON_ID=1034604 /ORGANISM="Chlamydomonas leiostraca, Strain SAG 11-49" /LENGTH=600 /DNA_ID=CAMNT_0049568961 /DNA_START=45 /DNA_END=1847 /DNA_ORIENTATION=+
MEATTAEALAKAQKKLKKAQAAGDEALIAKFEKKVKKLQKKAAEPQENGGAADMEAEAATSGKKRKKEQANGTPSGHANGHAASEDGEEEAAPKKSKKDKKDKSAANGHSTDTGAAGPAPLAEVGSVELARSGKPIKKDLYAKVHPEVGGMSVARMEEVRQERATTVEGRNGAATNTRFAPMLKFEHTGLPANVLHSTREFQAPSPIQSQCWPIILSGHDLIGIAATGSGKTLGFGLPMLAHITAQREAGVVGKGKGPYALVMAPTRELALQINQVLHDAGAKCGVRSVCVYGGVPKKEQVDALRRGVEIVVGTPGRLEDLMNDGVCVLSEVTYLVLDEADRMLDLGFEPHIRAICSKVRSDRQTLMFSATWPTAVQKLASNFLSRPVRVTIGSQDLAASHSITQHVEVIDPRARDDRLLALMNQYHSSRKNRCIIFVLYKKEAPRVEQLLQRRGWKCAAIHGDISQGQRTAAVEAFKAGTIPLLIATDVAARGLDIPDVEVVINYSFPLTTEDYVHRIGRTGRAGKSGIAHTFFCAVQDKPRAGELINVLREAGQKVPEDLLKFGTAVKKKESKLYGAHFKDVDVEAKATKVTFDSDDE